jgi:threonine aldolase
VLENTHNRGGGRIYPLKNFEAIHAFTKRHGLALHLDGARLWNAVAATGIKPATWAAHFDTVSVCFSKGLGAPIGSALVGPRDFVTRARFVRKLFGGAMRQVGVLAAAALYALDHHVERLVEDHRNAQTIAEAVADSPGLHLDPPDVQTNIVYLNIDRELGSAESFASTLKARGVLVGATGPQRLRAVTHLDVSSAQAVQAADILRKTAKEAVHAKVGVHPELAK